MQVFAGHLQPIHHPWIPAFAGMTIWGAGNDEGGGGSYELGGRMTMVGAGLLSVVGDWTGYCPVARRPSGFRLSPE